MGTLFVKALANEDTFTLLPTQMFPCFPTRATFVADTNFVSGTQKMFLILFRNILCPQQMFPSLRAQRNIMSNNVSATMCLRLPLPLANTTNKLPRAPVPMICFKSINTPPLLPWKILWNRPPKKPLLKFRFSFPCSYIIPQSSEFQSLTMGWVQGYVLEQHNEKSDGFLGQAVGILDDEGSPMFITTLFLDSISFPSPRLQF